MITLMMRLFAGLILSVSCTGAIAADTQAGRSQNNWQMKMLYQPGQFQLAREARGHVNIYDGLTDAEVHKAMDVSFDRIENMMFTRVRVADASLVSAKKTGGERVMGSLADTEDCD